jgi:hypothetical protein
LESIDSLTQGLKHAREVLILNYWYTNEHGILLHLFRSSFFTLISVLYILHIFCKIYIQVFTCFGAILSGSFAKISTFNYLFLVHWNMIFIQ